VEPDCHMRIALGAFRTMGLPFAVAWKRAINTLPRDDDEWDQWLELLRWGQPAWQAAYEGGNYEVIARPAGDWDAEPDVDATILAYVGAAVGASNGADPAGVRTIADPPAGPAGAEQAPDSPASLPA
jgi:hypothetical protein